MSIVRVGLAETKNFATGYEAIFGKRSAEPKTPVRKAARPAKAAARAKPPRAKAKKKPAKKRK